METLGLNTNKPIILISDDEQDTRDFLSKIYKRDFRVVTAQSGRETLEIFQKIPIDLILLDAHMPDMDGFSVCQKLRNGYSHNYVYRPYIMMMTGFSDDKSIDKAFDCGADDYITKPINVNVLKRRTQAILDSKRLQDVLMDSETKLNTIFENATDGIIVVDIETKKFTTGNKMICDMTGYSKDELIGLSVMDIHPKEDVPYILAQFELQVKQEFTLVERVPVLRKDGTVFYADINAFPVKLQDKNYLVGLFRDITNRLNLTIELDKQKHLLEDKVAERTSELTESMKKLRYIIDSIIKAMAMTIEAKDPYTAGHQRQVSDIARKIGIKMGLPKDQIEGIRVAGILHDLGKIQVPSEILSKPSKLNDFEFGLIKMHSESGYNILKGIDFPWAVADIVRQHHEKINGSGYPLGIGGDDIILEAKILCVADVYDAIVSHRPYRAALGKDFAMDEFKKNKGVFYDSMVVEAFTEAVKDNGFFQFENSLDM